MIYFRLKNTFWYPSIPKNSSTFQKVCRSPAVCNIVPPQLGNSLAVMNSRQIATPMSDSPVPTRGTPGFMNDVSFGATWLLAGMLHHGTRIPSDPSVIFRAKGQPSRCLTIDWGLSLSSLWLRFRLRHGPEAKSAPWNATARKIYLFNFCRTSFSLRHPSFELQVVVAAAGPVWCCTFQAVNKIKCNKDSACFRSMHAATATALPSVVSIGRGQANPGQVRNGQRQRGQRDWYGGKVLGVFWSIK